jgi:hypothetical protein
MDSVKPIFLACAMLASVLVLISSPVYATELTNGTLKEQIRFGQSPVWSIAPLPAHSL